MNRSQRLQQREGRAEPHPTQGPTRPSQGPPPGEHVDPERDADGQGSSAGHVVQAIRQGSSASQVQGLTLCLPPGAACQPCMRDTLLTPRCTAEVACPQPRGQCPARGRPGAARARADQRPRCQECPGTSLPDSAQHWGSALETHGRCHLPHAAGAGCSKPCVQGPASGRGAQTGSE